MALAGDIEAIDYNTIRGKIIEVMGTGLGSYGYGQSTVSSAVSTGNTITAQQWTELRYDVINALIHQTGTTPSAVLIRSGDVIDDQASDPVVNYNTLTNTARSNRFDLAPTQSLITPVGSGDATPTPVAGEYVLTSSWGSSATLDVTMTFTTAEEARFFFNSGGNIQITATRTGGASTLQNQSWTDLLTEAGTLLFKATTGDDNNFYTLTTNYQTIHELSSSAAYADNTFKISAKCDVADNSLGTAKVIDVRIELLDNYLDPDVVAGFPADENLPEDVVDGTLTITVVEQKASGVLQPSEVADGGPTGNFSITSPSYTVSNITAT